MPITNPGGASAQMDFIETFEAIDCANAALSANTAYLMRVRVSDPISITKLTYHIGTTSGNVDAGVFTSTDLTNFTLIASSGSTAAGTTNTDPELTLTAGVTLVPDVDYWLAFVADNATAAILRKNISFTGGANHGGLKNRMLSKASLFPLATFATPAVSANGVWLMAS